NQTATGVTHPHSLHDALPISPQPATTAPAAPATPYVLPGNTPDEQYQHAFGLLRQADYAEAERALSAFIERNPASPLAGNAQYWDRKSTRLNSSHVKRSYAVF